MVDTVASEVPTWDRPWSYEDDAVLRSTSTTAESIWQTNTTWALLKSDVVLYANLRKFKDLIHIVEQKLLRRSTLEGRRLLARLRVAEAAVKAVKEGRG